MNKEYCDQSFRPWGYGPFEMIDVARFPAGLLLMINPPDMSLGFQQCIGWGYCRYYKRSSAWAMHTQWVSAKEDECATCDRTSDALPSTTMPDASMTCPPNYEVSEKEFCAMASKDYPYARHDHVALANCSSLGSDYVDTSSDSDTCQPTTWDINLVGRKYVCRTCVLSASTTSVVSTMTTTTTTTTSSSSYVREWEAFAGTSNLACRGAGADDNNPKHYEVHLKVGSLKACQDLCVQTKGPEGCKGTFALQVVLKVVLLHWHSGRSFDPRNRSSCDWLDHKFSLLYSLLYRSFGFHFACIHLVWTRTLIFPFVSLSLGIEFNFNSGRCELWTRPEGIWSTVEPRWLGFTCMRYGWPAKYLTPANSGRCVKQPLICCVWKHTDLMLVWFGD